MYLIAAGSAVTALNGTPGRDTLNGTPDNDIIIGFQGADTITGGGGADEFVYTNNIRDAGDTITDFEVGIDKIVLRELTPSLRYIFTFTLSNLVAYGGLSFVTQAADTILLIDLDGLGVMGPNKAVKFITFKNVSAAELNNPINFMF